MRKSQSFIAISTSALVLYAASGLAQAQCAGDLDGDGQVTIEEIIVAVNNALSGCPDVEVTPTPDVTSTFTPTPTMSGSPDEEVTPTPSPTPCTTVFTCTCTAGGCGNCGVGGDQNDVHENVSCEVANDVCAYKDGPCNNPNLPGCDGSRVFVHGWTCEPNP
jgi:hypothetical protein